MVLINRKRKTEKTSKGYRLKITTHKLIDKIQIILNADQDEVITRACRAYYKSLNKLNNKLIKKSSNNKQEVNMDPPN
jgi:hypothetical protein